MDLNHNTGFVSYHSKSTYIDNFGFQDRGMCALCICLYAQAICILFSGRQTEQHFFFFSFLYFFSHAIINVFVDVVLLSFSDSKKKKKILFLPLFRNNDENLTRFHFNVFFSQFDLL